MDWLAYRDCPDCEPKTQPRRAFVVCPVRNITPEQERDITVAIQGLENEGYEVYWPLRDTPQGDPNGIMICRKNRQAIKRATLIGIWYDPNSQGSLFDLGMTFAFRKPIRLLNTVEPTPIKSFANVLLTWEEKP